MRRLILTGMSLLILNGCDHPMSTMAQGYDFFSYYDVQQGHYEKAYYEIHDYSMTEMDFDILAYHGGKWSPLNTLSLTDKTMDKNLSVKYVVESSGDKYIHLQLRDESEVLFDEEYYLRKPVNHIKLDWFDRNVIISAGEFEFAMSMHFEPVMIANTVSSMEVINRIRFE